MNFIIKIILIGITVGLLILLIGIYGPFYRTKVVNQPVNLQLPSVYQLKFTVDRSVNYMIEIHLSTIFPEEKMETILGEYVKGNAGEIKVLWNVSTNNILIAEGSNTEYGYSPIWGKDRSGLTIGTFNAERGKEYTLYIATKNKSLDWNMASPYIEARR